MRLTQQQIQLVVQSIHRHLGENARIWLFGSRLDDDRKGGDLDLYVETDRHPLRSEFRCKIDLEETLDIPVDIIVREFEEPTPIGIIAKKNGVRL